MSERPGPVYEATFFIDPAILPDFETWLTGEIDRIRTLSGVVDCRDLSMPDDEDGRNVRLFQIDFESGDDADAFVDGDVFAQEGGLLPLFGDQVSLRTRLLVEEDIFEPQPEHPPDCLNCGKRLRGQYCGDCGQRSRSRLISLWELITDAFGDLFELDSRLWQTLVPLVIQPGRLTYDYLQGRRSRFMPPFRMYLVLSLVFFLVAFANPREKFGVLFEPAPAENTIGSAAPATDVDDAASNAPDEVEQRRQEMLDELTGESIVVGTVQTEKADDDSGAADVHLGSDGEGEFRCDIDQSDVDDLPDWIARRLTVERVQHICERLRLDNGRAFLDDIVDTIPTALIVLLPFMAFILTMLYPLSRRYYVEHLLFLVHFHAFFFLLLTLQILFARLGALVRLPELVSTLALVATSIYIPVYLFVAMRKVYGQSRLVTFLKYTALTIAYIAGLTTTMLAATLLVALSI